MEIVSNEIKDIERIIKGFRWLIFAVVALFEWLSIFRAELKTNPEARARFLIVVLLLVGFVAGFVCGSAFSFAHAMDAQVAHFSQLIEEKCGHDSNAIAKYNSDYNLDFYLVGAQAHDENHNPD